MTTVLITSGAYVGTEFVAEFGRLPPAFLPVGNRRLYERQIERLRSANPARLLLSIPEDFTPDEFDLAKLEHLGVELVRVPDNLRLGESVVFVLNVTAPGDGELRILHGDTLIEDIDFPQLDVVSVDSTDEYYLWAEWRDEDKGLPAVMDEFPTTGTGRQYLSGYFSFSSSHLLVQSITRARGDFIAGLMGYSGSRRLRPIKTGAWMDFGHLQTYYQSRTRMTTQRAFNDLQITGRVVAKSSHDARKMLAEAAWYEKLPPRLRTFTPHLLGVSTETSQISYEVEYLHHLPLSDLYVFGRLPQVVWRSIFRALDEWVTACSGYQPEAATQEIEATRTLYREKTMERLERFAADTGLDLDGHWVLNGQELPSLRAITEAAAAAVRPPEEQDIRVIHGDLCFSNILYDFRTQRVKLIDPRALNGRGEPTIYGDRRYDLAKLHHSVVGLYDFIIAGQYRLDVRPDRRIEFALPTEGRIREIQEEFLRTRFGGLTLHDAASLPISILFFLSMLPLHADHPQRQMAMLANALRLYDTLVAQGARADSLAIV
ncbi:phosphotransferase [Azospirillum himalayense]|uniref:Phosphotransferase n=1 Tax=Azospirillum himalayense TaxID=654847 RepID=A0ABW0G3U8_9PROT